MKIFKTEVFQGNLSKKNYFEGWYFKNVSADNNSVYAFIPGVSLADGDSHSFIQIINGISGETQYIAYDIKDFKWKKDKLWVQVGSSVFTDKYIDINIDNKDKALVEVQINRAGHRRPAKWEEKVTSYALI